MGIGDNTEMKPLLPGCWNITYFEDIASSDKHALKAGPFGSALKKSDCVSSGIKVYGQEQVIAGDENLDTYFISDEKYEQLRSCTVGSGDILISLVGTIGKVLILSESSKKGIINPRLVKLSLDSRINRSYIRYFLYGPQAISFFKSFSHGGTMDILNLGILKRLPISLPPTNEQTRIANKLDELLAQVDTIKARVDAIPAILKRFRQSVLAAAVSGKLTEEWRKERSVNWEPKIGPISEFCSIDIGNAFKSKEFTDEGIPLLRGQNIEPSRLRWIETKRYPKEKLEQFKHLFIEENDIILAMDRPIVSAGLKLARATLSDLPCVLVQRVARFKDFKGISPNYLYLMLSDISFSNYLAPNQTGSDIPHISGKQILAYVVTVPEEDEQDEIVMQVDRFFVFADQIEQRVKAAQSRINNLTQSILAKAFRGELVPQDPNDEPASELLERIKKEREQAAALTKATKKVTKKKAKAK